MKEIKLTYNFNELLNIADNSFINASEEALPNTAQAFREGANTIYTAWSEFLMGNSSIDGVKPLDKPMNKSVVTSLKNRKLRDFHYSVFSNNPQMDKLIEGSPEVKYDMKTTHPYGRKSRISKKGIPYLIIPFRWGTPNGHDTKRAHFNNFIPTKNYNTSLKGFKLSYRTGLTHFERNAHGEPINRSEYRFNDRLKEDAAWSDNSVGMVRMKDVRGSSYFTFRIVSAKSPSSSWWYKRKAEDSRDIIKGLENMYSRNIQENIENALKKDISENFIRKG